MSLLIAAFMQLASRVPELPAGAQVTPPDWLERPSADVLTANYPKAALKQGVSGSVVISCIITALGTLDPCEVLAEAPEGMGFGDAALASARSFRMRPLMVDGRPTGGPVVNIPLAFTTGAPVGWPARAWEEKVEGEALLSCRLNENLNPADCAVSSETPPGYNLGAFAKVRARLLRIETKPDGTPLHPGETVNLPVLFRRGGERGADEQPKGPALHPEGER